MCESSQECDVIDPNHMLHNDDALALAYWKLRSESSLEIPRERKSENYLSSFLWADVPWIVPTCSSWSSSPISCKLLRAHNKLIRFSKDCDADKRWRLSFVKFSHSLSCESSIETSAEFFSFLRASFAIRRVCRVVIRIISGLLLISSWSVNSLEYFF